MKQLYLQGQHAVLDTPYDKNEVAALKETLPAAKWDRVKKVWRIPARYLQTAIEFADTWGIQVDTDLLMINLPEHPIGETSIEVTDTMVTVNVPYETITVGHLKSIPGVKWNPKGRNWVAPLKIIHDIIEWATHHKIDLPADVKAIAESRQQEEERFQQLSSALDADITIPNFGLDLYGFQRAGVLYASEKLRTFIADEMGLGKSIEALATAEYTFKYPLLIVCPSSLTEDWKIKVEEALPHRSVSTISTRKTQDPPTTEIVIIGYSVIYAHRNMLKKHGFQGLIVDESQYCKTATAQRTKGVKAVAKEIPEDGLRLLLTGTPIENSPKEYTQQLIILGRMEEFGGEWNFWKRYCGAYHDKYQVLHNDGATNQEELLERLKSICYIRREKRDVLPDLPEMTHNLIHVQMPPKYQAEYNHALLDFEDWYQNRYDRKLWHGDYDDLREIAALRQIVAKSKLKQAIEWVQQANDAGHKIVIAAHHRDITTTLTQELDAVHIIGGQTATKTEEAKKQFQNDPAVKNMVISNQAAKTGHTLTAASNLLMVEAPWTPTDYQQIAGRIHRIGQTLPCTIHNMVNFNTIDRAIYGILLNKERKIMPATSNTAPHVLEELMK